MTEKLEKRLGWRARQSWRRLITGFVYIMSNRPRGALYVGVTSDLLARVHQHREGDVDGFSKRYGLKRLVWFETTESIEDAIAHEKSLKRWRRSWKVELIEKINPDWRDLWDEISA